MSGLFVSVIVPNYNHARFLRQRLDSILNQTYQNFELIILDDCSTDNSREIIESYRHNPHVSQIVYNETNSGSTFKQWKKGLDLVKGDLVWIAESDDYCELNLLETLVAEFNNRDSVGVVYSFSQLVDDNGIEIPTSYDESFKRAYFKGGDFITTMMARDSEIKNASSALFRFDLYKKITHQWVEMKAAGDRLFWILLSEKSDVVYINEKLNYFRATNSLEKVSPKKFRDGITLRESKIIDQYLIDKGYLIGWNRLMTLCYRLNQIYTCDFDSEKIRKSLLRLYNHHGLINYPVFKILTIVAMMHNRLIR